MVTRRNRPETKAADTEEELRLLLEQRTREVDELQQHIRDLEARGARFLSDAAHAVMNPLTIVQSYLEIIISDLPEGLSPQQIEFVETARVAASRMRRMIDGLVELAAIELGAAEFELCGLAVEDVVTGVSSAVGPAARNAGVDISTSIPPHLPRVRADACRLANAVEAVLSNAIRVTPRGGRITVTAAHRGETVVISVADTGPGIPDDQLQRVFDAFARLPKRPGDPAQGVGLGLTVARRQLEAFGGRIEVSSTLKQGSTFSLEIPVFREDAPP